MGNNIGRFLTFGGNYFWGKLLESVVKYLRNRGSVKMSTTLRTLDVKGKAKAKAKCLAGLDSVPHHKMGKMGCTELIIVPSKAK